jgi:(p)ppGpp synthase/HD superfamily hydrolase
MSSAFDKDSTTKIGKQEGIAKAIAYEAHEGQLDKGGFPYINHPASVASVLHGDRLRAVGWLHDVIEDTEWTLDDLRERGVEEDVIHSVDVLTRRKHEETYSEYIERVAQDEMARQVKVADLWHNSDPSRWRRGMRPSLRKRYKKALEFLGEDTSEYDLNPPYVD